MTTIKIRHSVISTAGDSQRLNALELQYDGRIPDHAKAVARYGSPQAAALVEADQSVKSARRVVRDTLKVVRAWQANPKGYTAETIREVLERNRNDVPRMLAYYRATQQHLIACEAAYQALERCTLFKPCG